MANPNGTVENLNHTLTKDELRLGGINSGISRRNNAVIKKSLEKILSSGIKIPKNIKDEEIKKLIEKLKSLGVDTNNIELTDLMNFGQILGSIYGRAECYRLLLEANDEKQEESTSTPTIKIEINDNSNLEGIMYEANKSDKNDEG